MLATRPFYGEWYGREENQVRVIHGFHIGPNDRKMNSRS